MHPILFHLPTPWGPQPVFAYGLLLSLSILLGWQLTVRLALKEAGLSADAVLPLEMQVVLQKLMPKELAARAVPGVDDVCKKISAGVASLKDTATAQSPEAVFSRLAGG